MKLSPLDSIGGKASLNLDIDNDLLICNRKPSQLILGYPVH